MNPPTSAYNNIEGPRHHHLPYRQSTSTVNTPTRTLQDRILDLELRLRRFGLLSNQSSRSSSSERRPQRSQPNTPFSVRGPPDSFLRRSDRLSASGASCRSTSMPPGSGDDKTRAPPAAQPPTTAFALASPAQNRRPNMSANNLQLDFSRTPVRESVDQAPGTSSTSPPDSASPGSGGRRPPRQRPSLGNTPLTPSPNKPPSEYKKEWERQKNKPGQLKIPVNVDGIIKMEEVEFEANDLKQLADLGHGTCGQVFKMKHVDTDTVLAVKQMRMTNVDEELKRILTDLAVAKKASHRNIVAFYGYLFTDSELWICMELMSTCFGKVIDLFAKLRQSGASASTLKVPEPILGQAVVAIVNGLHYMKTELKLVHRDVKPSNVLLNSDGRVKMCDFGIAGTLENSIVQSMGAGKGCAAYMAPERLEPSKNSDGYGARTDVWSLGVTTVELATGSHPYQGSNQFDTLAKIVNNEPPVLNEAAGYTTELCQFVKLCLAKEPNHRANYDKLMQTPFYQMHADVADGQKLVADWFATLRIEDGRR